MKIVNYAVRKTHDNKYELCQVSIMDTLHGRRKFSETQGLRYKRMEYAIKEAHNFFHNVYDNWTNTKIVFIGVLEKDEYRGELA